MALQGDRNSRGAIPRRQFLKGLGATITLPALGSLGGSKLYAAEQAARATTATGAPLRTAFVYFPNGSIPGSWWPEQTGTDFTLAKTLEPLNRFKSQLQLFAGLDQVNADGSKDGAGDHARANSVFLTGIRLHKSPTDARAGVSIDQRIANHVGSQTLFPSIELSSDHEKPSGACDSGYACAYVQNISWKSATTPMPPERNPRLMFERLFGAGSPAERAANLKQRRAEQRSILDFVLDDARRMGTRLANKDRQKLDQYLTSVRDIEVRLERAERMPDPKDPGVDAPAGISQDYAEHIALHFDMMLLAFQADLTRVATLMLAHDGSNRSFDHIGISEGHHELTHHRNDEGRVQKVAAIDLWYVQQFAKFVERMQNTLDVDGKSLLDNSMIVYGSGNADGNRHTHTNLPIILAGGGGGSLTPGRYVNHGSRPLCDLFLSLADRMGVTGLERFGDSTGRLADI